MKKLHLKVFAMLLFVVVYVTVYTASQWKTAHTVSTLMQVPVTVIVDAGHGGEDCGALSSAGIRESDINLYISLKLEQMLALCGIRPYLIRDEDISVHTEGNTIRERKVSDLNNRIDIINSFQNAVVISIHQNHFSESRYSGAQVFYAQTERSKDLADKTQTYLKIALDPSNRRETKEAESVYIMKKIRCPGILVECGFLSNPQEERLLLNDNYQTKVSCAISCALIQYLEKGVREVEV